MEGRNVQGMLPQNYGQLNQANLDKAIAQARLDGKQEALFNAISNVVKASAKDLYGTPAEKKTRYVVDLIIKRITALLQTETASSDKIKEIIDTSIKEELKDTLNEQAKQQSKQLSQISENSKRLEQIKELLASGSQKKASTNESKDISQSASISSPQANIVVGIVANTIQKFTKLSEQLQKQTQQQMKNIQDASNSAASSSIQQMFDNINEQALSAEQLHEKIKEIVENGNEEITNELKKISSKSLASKIVDNLLSGGWKVIKAIFGFSFNKILLPILNNVIWKPIKAAFGAFKKLLLAPLDFLKNEVTSIAKGLAKGAFNILGAFFSTPAGMIALGFIVGFAWKRWIEPFWLKVQKFYDEYIEPIIQPFKQWFDGKMTFTDACSAAWKKLKEEVWKDWLKPKWDEFKEKHPMLAWLTKFTLEHPIVSFLGLWVAKKLLPELTSWLAKKSFVGIIKGLKWLSSKTILAPLKLLGNFFSALGITGAMVGTAMITAMVGTFWRSWLDAKKLKDQTKKTLIYGGEVEGLLGAKSITNEMTQRALRNPDNAVGRFQQLAQDEFDQRIEGYLSGEKKLEQLVDDILLNETNNVNVRAQTKGSQNLAKMLAILSTATPEQAQKILSQISENEFISDDIKKLLSSKTDNTFSIADYAKNEKFMAAIEDMAFDESKHWSKVLSTSKYGYDEAAGEITTAADQMLSHIKESGQAIISQETLLKAVDSSIEELAANNQKDTLYYKTLKELKNDISSGNKDIVSLLTALISKEMPKEQRGMNALAIFQGSEKQELIGVQ